jgi:hypothetical protein
MTVAPETDEPPPRLRGDIVAIHRRHDRLSANSVLGHQF